MGIFNYVVVSMTTVVPIFNSFFGLVKLKVAIIILVLILNERLGTYVS